MNNENECWSSDCVATTTSLIGENVVTWIELFRHDDEFIERGHIDVEEGVIPVEGATPDQDIFNWWRRLIKGVWEGYWTSVGVW